MSGPASSAAAIVASTDCDWPTSFIAPAANDAARLLEEAGFHVFALSGEDATAVQLHLILAEHTQFAVQPDDKQRFVIGFFCSHGDQEGRGLVDVDGRLLLDKKQCRLFETADLFMCSCLAGSRFPAAVAAESQGRVTVFGFEQHLIVGAQDRVRRCAGSSFDAYRERFNAALVEPLRVLLTPGATKAQALQAGMTAWENLWKDDSLHTDLKFYCFYNRRRLRSW